jgi:hypothetical protein
LAIRGKHGILAVRPDCSRDDESSRRWNNVKKRLSFCRITQDGNDEGCLPLDRLPIRAEADVIRDAVHVLRTANPCVSCHCIRPVHLDVDR